MEAKETQRPEKKKQKKQPKQPPQQKTKEEERVRETERRSDYTTVRHSYYDFSDIQGMADNEGFKVRISSTDKVRDSGRILINKLLFHSSLLFFLILAAETAVLYFTTSNTAGLNFLPYGIFMAIIALFPLTTAIMYLISPNRRIPKVATFKSAVELLSLIMLNLILIEIVCCVLSNINFSDQQSVMRYIVYPTFFVINLPIYLFIKYLKLDKDRYYES